MPSAYHIVHYRHFIGTNHEGKKLEHLCRSVLDQQNPQGASLWERVVDRVQTLDTDGARQLVLNKVADLSSAVFGEVCLVDTKGLQALLQSQRSTVELSDKTKAEVFNLDERVAPAGSQFLRGMAYWLAVGDHLFFVKTSGMTSDLLRGHFEWLIKSHPNGLAPAGNFTLQSEFDRSQLSGDIGDIRNLRVKGSTVPSFRVDTIDAPTEGSVIRRTLRSVGDRFVQFQQALPIVEALLGPAKTESLVASLGPDEYLTVDASVKVQGKRTEESKANLKKLANDLADITDGTVQVEGRDGKLSDGDAILRTNMPFDLPHAGSNLLDFNNVSDQLQEVYSRFVRDGKILA
ncbi:MULTISPECIES: hypothetical protein [Mesorhizobium]|uniref:hypothetical protein n=1 Tax=Mesorhizobium TaxID=68287 RepID=UPI0003CE29EC|nr:MULTISPECIES: hypothetical protein [Mesorhizobium]ESY71003.1 hypothetical protein X742_01540 [Mesorhizobium sp. LNHC232B00]WJI40934.1 hypothetical protein NL534_12090 [Mesorhizobium opportunistum]